jgi:hypothetical protein
VVQAEIAAEKRPRRGNNRDFLKKKVGNAESGNSPLAHVHFGVYTWAFQYGRFAMAAVASLKLKTLEKKQPVAELHAEQVYETQPELTPFKATTKTTDNKGRVVLGGRFANRAVIVEQLSETEMVIKLARVIPESEAWLYDNAAALTAVRNGLAQARAGEVTEGPNVDTDTDFAAQLED